MLKRHIKTINNFANASLFFWLLMIAITAAISSITVIDTTAPVWQWIEFITHTAGMLGVVSLILCFTIMLNDFIDKQELQSGEKYSESEVGFTRIQRNDEGEEIKRTKHTVKFHHNMPRPVLEKTLKIWQATQCEHDEEDADFSTASLCMFVNHKTNYIAAETEEEFLRLLSKNL